MHDISIAKYSGTIEELVEDVGNLRYDVLAKFLLDLGNKIMDDACADEKRGRSKLASNLFAADDSLAAASGMIGNAWAICEPHMDDVVDK